MIASFTEIESHFLICYGAARVELERAAAQQLLADAEAVEAVLRSITGPMNGRELFG